MVDIKDYGHKVADAWDDNYHKGLKGAIRKHPLTWGWCLLGAGAALGFIVGAILL